jgi:hypothetical protein
MTHLLARLNSSSDEVESIVQDLYVNKDSGPDGTAFFPTGGRFYTLLRYSKNVGLTTLQTIVVWQYYLQFQGILNCRFIEEWSTT